jgi:hypothetical protein
MTNLILPIILIVLGLSFPLGACLYIKHDDNNSKSGKYKTVKSSDKKNKENKNIPIPELKKLMGMDDIKNNIVHLVNGNSRIILSVSSPDIQLLTDDEIDVIELKLLQFALSLNDSIQFYTTPTRIETKEPANLVLQTAESNDELVSEKLKSYSSNLYKDYRNIENNRGVYVLRSFCVIGTNIKEKDRALNDLKYKVDMIASKLLGAKMRVSILRSEECAQLFADIMQRGDNIQIEKLIKNGLLEFYSEGIGQNIYSEGDNQDDPKKETA